MPLLGAHMSIAGGLYKAVEAAAALRMDCVQIFTASPRRFPVVRRDRKSGRLQTKIRGNWDENPFPDGEADRFREALEETGVRRPCAHACYLINVGTPDADLWERSCDGLVMELVRAEQLGLGGVVIHPGSYTTSSEEDGLKQIVGGLDRALDETDGAQIEIWLENTAGQGTNLGHRFEHLAWLIDNVQDSTRIGVCLDTCHMFAAGYPLKTPDEYAQTIDEFDSVVGLDRVRAFHLNDSKGDLGSRVDRHDHIGEGKLGREPFRHVLTDARFAELPMYLETPKKEDDREMDPVNLRRLRRLAKRK